MSDYEPAFDAAIACSRAEIEAIDKASNEHDPAMQALDTEDERLDAHED